MQNVVRTELRLLLFFFVTEKKNRKPKIKQKNSEPMVKPFQQKVPESHKAALIT